jgi:Uma2 family endonuclease
MGAVQTLEPSDFTLAELDALPEDGKQHELVDGLHLVTPSPTRLHQVAVVRFTYLLEHHCPAEYEVLVAPMDYRPNLQRSLQPDVMVANPEDTALTALVRPLLLAVEVLSPSTRMKDLLLKRGIYQESGVSSYWIFDPAEETLTVLELVGGQYVERAVVKGDDVYEADLPFPVRIVPTEVVRRVNRSTPDRLPGAK